MGRIYFDTDCNAPGCPGMIVNADDPSRTVLVQTDWDYPGVASTFGWDKSDVQPRCPDCGNELGSDDAIADHCGCEACDHTHTDGTVTCPDCGLTAGDFISAAGEYLDNADGETVDDPGYFA